MPNKHLILSQQMSPKYIRIEMAMDFIALQAAT